MNLPKISMSNGVLYSTQRELFEFQSFWKNIFPCSEISVNIVLKFYEYIKNIKKDIDEYFDKNMNKIKII